MTEFEGPVIQPGFEGIKGPEIVEYGPKYFKIAEGERIYPQNGGEGPANKRFEARPLSWKVRKHNGYMVNSDDPELGYKLPGGEVHKMPKGFVFGAARATPIKK